MSCDIQMIRPGSPLIGGPAQRRRIHEEEHFIWRRFLDKPDAYAPLVLIEKPNPGILDNILTKYKDDPLITSNMESKIAPMKRQFDGCGWSRKVEMKQKEFQFPLSYKGARVISRSYGQKMTFMPSKIVNTMYRETHASIDMVNSNFCILRSVFDHLDLPYIRYYVANRDTVIHEFSRLGISAKEVKMAFLSLIGSCPRLPVDFGLDDKSPDKIRTLSENAGIVGVQMELIRCYEEMIKDYPDFVQGMDEHARREGKYDHRGGIALCHLCFDIEDAITRVALRVLQDDETDDLSKEVVWKFDGLIVPKTMAYGGEDTLIKIQQTVKAELGIDVKYAFQMMDLDVFPGCEVGIENDAYKRFKREFERTYFKLSHPATYCRLINGEVDMMSDREWKLIHMEKPKALVEQWEQDPEKRFYQKLDCLPPPLSVPPGVFNTWTGFAAAECVEPMSQRELDERWVKWAIHVDNMMGHDKEAERWFHDILAHIFQKPGIKTQKLMFVRSIQGTGKDQMTRFLIKIMGEKVACKIDTFAELVNTKSALLQNKVLVVISESNYKDFTDEYYKKIKSMTTRETFLVTQKYEKDYISRCMVNMIFNTNDMGGLNMNVMERRFICAQADSRIASDPEYHVPFNAYIEDPMNQVAVFRKYLQRDISTFNPFQKVVTKVQAEMSNQSIFSSPMVTIFKERLDEWVSIAEGNSNPAYATFGDSFVQLSVDAMNDEFKEFYTKLGWKGCENKASTAQISSRHLVEANAQATKFAPRDIVPIEKVRRRSAGSRTYYYILHIPTIKRWVKEMMCEKDDDVLYDGPLPDAFARAAASKDKMEVTGSAYGPSPKFRVTRNGDEILATDNVEDVNKIMGHPYIDKNEEEGKWILHNPISHEKIELGDFYKGDYSAAKINHKYPWYIEDRYSFNA
jgi:Family of unknown function (DUF5906)